MPKEENKGNKNGNSGKIIAILVAVIAVLVIALVIVLISMRNKKSEKAEATTTVAEASTIEETIEESKTEEVTVAEALSAVAEITTEAAETTVPETASEAPAVKEENFDLFEYCKNFAIQIGELNGDYCMYQQPSELYGGYENEYYSLSYWGDSDMVEFCLHCPLDDLTSINFYLRMRGGYDGTYEYCTSKYYRSDGSSFREARGTIDPAVFSEQYPLNCDEYYGDSSGQTEFMEESRVGMVDLIKTLKQFVEVENMDCGFEDFGFVNF